MKNRDIDYKEIFDALFYENERDIKVADVQIMWFTEEISALKYNSLNEAKESLEVWTTRKNNLLKRKQQLFEMEALYKSKNKDYV